MNIIIIIIINFYISFFHDKDIKVFYDKSSVMEINRY